MELEEAQMELEEALPELMRLRPHHDKPMMHHRQPHTCVNYLDVCPNPQEQAGADVLRAARYASAERIGRR